MSYSVFAAILLATIALSSASRPVFHKEQHVLVRLYSDYAQVHRPATMKTYVDERRTMERYEFFFTTSEFSRITEGSLRLLNADVIEQIVTFNPAPNFINGSRFIYRRDPKQIDGVEVELVNPADRLVREVAQPDRYFFLPYYADLEFVGAVPVVPYYNVTFICNASSSQQRSPRLEYLDRSLYYFHRYIVNVPALGSEKPAEINAFVDIRNIGGQTFFIKGAELVAGNDRLHYNQPKHVARIFSGKRDDSLFLNRTRPYGQGEVGSYIYPLTLPSTIVLPTHSVKSIPFLQINITIDRFLGYSSVFSPMDSTGKLFNIYNLTSVNTFLPRGYATFYDQGRSIDNIFLPDLVSGKSFQAIFGADANTSYDRRVTRLQDDEDSDFTTYYVEYRFKNSKPTCDLQFFFFESFSLFKYFQITDLSLPNGRGDRAPVVFNGSCLRGYVSVPREDGEAILSYNLVVYKSKSQYQN